jgi:hypothetical protein
MFNAIILSALRAFVCEKAKIFVILKGNITMIIETENTF